MDSAPGAAMRGMEPDTAERAADRGGTITFQQFVTDPDVAEASEWVRGEVIAMSPVGSEQTEVAGYLIALLINYVGARGLGRVYHEPLQMRLADSSRAPDVLVVLTPHLERVKANYLDGPADLVIEVIPPGSAGRDRGEKYYEYEAAGVPEYWLLDPRRETAEFYRLDERGVYTSFAADADGRLHSTAVPGLWIRVEWLWTRPNTFDVAREWGLI